VYGRTLDGDVLEFGHEGVLYRNSFVMYDRGTRSLWVHTTGQAVKGALRGKSLEFLPSEVVAWSVWRDRHPDTLVLDRGGEDTGFMGTFALPEKSEKYGYSVGSGTDATLYSYEILVDEVIVAHGEQVVVYIEESDTIRAYARGERTFEIDSDGLLSDGQGSTWDPVSGESETDGTRSLTRLPITPWLIKRWKGFYADGEVVDAESP
jgi:hypothetical protein